MSKQPWAYIDTEAYWMPGTNKIGTFGKVDFVSDRDARKLTRTYRSTYAHNGRSLGLDYYIIKVRFHGDGTEVIALYDDASHNVLFDDISIPDFTFKLDAWITFNDSNDIVQIAKRRNDGERMSGKDCHMRGVRLQEGQRGGSYRKGDLPTMRQLERRG